MIEIRRVDIETCRSKYEGRGWWDISDISDRPAFIGVYCYPVKYYLNTDYPKDTRISSWGAEDYYLAISLAVF